MNSRIILKITFLLILFFGDFFSQSADINIFLQGKKITDIKNDGVDIWVATEGDGIYKYQKWNNKWINYSTKTKKIKQDFFYCIEVGNRYIWAGSADGLYTFDKRRKRWTKKRFSLGGQFGNWIRSLKYDNNDKMLWIGRFKYLSSFNLISKIYKDYNLTKNNNEKSNSVLTVNTDGDSAIWIGVEAGVHKYNKNDTSFTTKFYNSETFFMKEGDQVSVSNILFEQNNIWFGTEEFRTRENPDFNLGGLFRYDRGINWKKFGEFSNLDGNGIFSLEITGNYIWSSVYKFDPESKSAEGKGLSLINRKTLETKKIISDLIPETVFCLHFDGESMWLGTNDGIRRISLTNNILPDFS